MFFKGFPQNNQITYAGMLWLLAAQLVVMAPLAFYLPVWLIPVLLLSAGWRIRVMKGHHEQPGNLIKIIISGLGVGALFLSGMELVSLDMIASLLMLGFSYKAIEIIQRRDGVVVILTGFILIAVLFLYSQTILTALYGVFALIVLSGAMIAIHQSSSHQIIKDLKLSSLMLMLCFPLMIVLFLFAPRLPPLWSVPVPGGSAKTGMSDMMSPGSITSLSQSDELAFNVKFLGARPKQTELYWYGIVLQHFDGNTWTQFAQQLDAKAVKSKLKTSQRQIHQRLFQQDGSKGVGLEYEVIYEKSGQPWLFALSPVVSIKGDAFFGNDFRIIANQDLLEPMLLSLVSYPQALRDVQLPTASRQLALQLPEQGNEQSRLLAQQLVATSTSKQDYIDNILKRYQQQAFYYTLRPPLMDQNNSIDDFLFNQKKGFCEHYAGSFVFMMRAAGIPARVIVGYQGGEWNNNGHFLSVRQYDAHAWAEVWLENRGWIRFDPTAMVAPERIEHNLQTAVDKEGSFLEAQTFSLSKNQWLISLRQRIDSTQYAWRRFVLGYDSDSQTQLLKRLFGDLSVQKIAFLVGGLFAAIILLWVVFLGLTKKHVSIAAEHRLYQHFCDFLEQQGISREPSQTPQALSQIAITKLPGLATEIKAFTRVYSALCYEPDQHHLHQQQINSLKKLLKKMQRQR
ncbi:MAG TPA: DUF3488 domain-containing protein [Crenotrichaceae bacterium]|nr:DUF3488 domain-containing protein [Crenotrichaceae bacterium]